MAAILALIVTIGKRLWDANPLTAECQSLPGFHAIT